MSVRKQTCCNECGISAPWQEPNVGAGAATMFCPRCQKTTTATNLVFCSGDINPTPLEPDDRRFSVCLDGYVVQRYDGDVVQRHELPMLKDDLKRLITGQVTEKPKPFMVAGADVTKDRITVTKKTPNAGIHRAAEGRPVE